MNKAASKALCKLIQRKKKIAVAEAISALQKRHAEILGKIEAGASGVVELRARLKIVTHQILKLELGA